MGTMGRWFSAALLLGLGACSSSKDATSTFLSGDQTPVTGEAAALCRRGAAILESAGCPAPSEPCDPPLACFTENRGLLNCIAEHSAQCGCGEEGLDCDALFDPRDGSAACRGEALALLDCEDIQGTVDTRDGCAQGGQSCDRGDCCGDLACIDGECRGASLQCAAEGGDCEVGDCCPGLFCDGGECRSGLPECADEGESCENDDCCDGLSCNGGECQQGSAACADEGESCENDDCCDGLSCGDGAICAP